jgi:peptide deformylase
MIRLILQLGNNLLRRKSSPVKDLHGQELTRLINDLSDTLKDAKERFGYGRGIAAPQIGEPRRVVFIDTPSLKTALINPRITWASEATFAVWDSCFCFNVEFFVLVDRHCRIKLEYSDAEGHKQAVEAEDGLSELLQHEIDHLDGVLATDRIKDAKKIMMRSEWEKLLKRTGAR